MTFNLEVINDTCLLVVKVFDGKGVITYDEKNNNISSNELYKIEVNNGPINFVIFQNEDLSTLDFMIYLLPPPPDVLPPPPKLPPPPLPPPNEEEGRVLFELGVLERTGED